MVNLVLSLISHPIYFSMKIIELIEMIYGPWVLLFIKYFVMIIRSLTFKKIKFSKKYINRVKNNFLKNYTGKLRKYL